MHSFLSTLSTYTVMWFLYHAHAHSRLHNILARTRTTTLPITDVHLPRGRDLAPGLFVFSLRQSLLSYMGQF